MSKPQKKSSSKGSSRGGSRPGTPITDNSAKTATDNTLSGAAVKLETQNGKLPWVVEAVGWILGLCSLLSFQYIIKNLRRNHPPKVPGSQPDTLISDNAWC